MTKVLVVDDSVSVRKALERVLAPRHLEVTAANSAEQALEKVTANKPDLVITDVVMPGMSGFEFCQMLKNTEPFTDIPVILISGIVDDHVLMQSKAVGASSVVTKPFTPEDLFPKIDSALAAVGQKAEVRKLEVVAQPALVSSAPVAVSKPTPMPSNPAPVSPPINHPPITPSVASPVVGGYSASGLRAHLEPLLEKPEIESALLVMNRTGEAISSVGQALTDPNTFATYCRTLVSISSVFGEQLGHPGLQGVTLEYAAKNVLLFSINERFSLALVMQGGSSAGIARYLVQRQTPLIRSVLEAN